VRTLNEGNRGGADVICAFRSHSVENRAASSESQARNPRQPPGEHSPQGLGRQRQFQCFQKMNRSSVSSPALVPLVQAEPDQDELMDMFRSPIKRGASPVRSINFASVNQGPWVATAAPMKILRDPCCCRQTESKPAADPRSRHGDRRFPEYLRALGPRHAPGAPSRSVAVDANPAPWEYARQALSQADFAPRSAALHQSGRGPMPWRCLTRAVLPMW